MKKWQVNFFMLASALVVAATVAASPVFGPPRQGEETPSRENCRIYYMRVHDPDPP